jgi:hypothetical protein
MSLSLTPDELFGPSQRLAAASRVAAARFPGDPGGRQAVHTVYGGAHLFRADTTQRLGALALRALEEYAPTAEEFARAMDLPPALAEAIDARVKDKLRREPVEDFRIDFEDGCRRFAAFASSRCRPSSRRAACGPSISSSPRCASRPLTPGPRGSSSRCPRSSGPRRSARWPTCSIPWRRRCASNPARCRSSS